VVVLIVKICTASAPGLSLRELNFTLQDSFVVESSGFDSLLSEEFSNLYWCVLINLLEGLPGGGPLLGPVKTKPGYQKLVTTADLTHVQDVLDTKLFLILLHSNSLFKFNILLTRYF